MSKTVKITQKLYNGDVEICFYPNSHRYKILKIKGKTEEEIKKINSQKSSGTSAPSIIDKSRVLINWATKLYTSTVKDLMNDGENFSRDDINSMLLEGEKAHHKKLKSAGDVGSEVHRYAEYYVKDRLEIESFENFKINDELSEDEKEKVEKGCVAFNSFIDKYKPVFKESERLCYSIKNNHLGIYDVEFELLEKFVGKEKAGVYIVDFKTSNGLYPEHEYQVSSYLKAREEETGQKYKGTCLIAFYKEDKENKDGEIIKSAGEFDVKFQTRGENVNNYKIYKACQVVEQEKKKRDTEYYNSLKK